MKLHPLMAALCGAALLNWGAVAAAQNYPSKPVRFVIPFAPGGSTDTLARAMGGKLAELLGQQVVIDNRPGANGDIGTGIVARAVPDGYTIVLGYIANFGIGPSLYDKMPYDPVKDFAPVTQVAGASNILVIHPSLPAKNFKEFIAYSKANPKKVTFASASVASVGHLTGELLNDLAGIDMVHVPYKGSGQAISDLVGGHIKVMISGMASTLPHVKSGKLRGIATTGAKRTPATPDLPTIAESGFPGFDASLWLAVMTPAGVPAPILDRLHKEVLTIIGNKDNVAALDKAGAEAITSTPAELMAMIRDGVGKYAKVIKEANIQVD